MIFIIESKFETPPVAEVEALLAHESQSNRFHKQSFSPSINYTQGYVLPNLNDTSTRNNSSGGYGRGGGAKVNAKLAGTRLLLHMEVLMNFILDLIRVNRTNDSRENRLRQCD